MNPDSTQRRFIDDTFFERNDYSEADFARLTTGAELHYLLQNHNWDGDNRLLQWLAESPLCSEATALEMFWLAQPQDFQHHALDKTLKSKHDRQTFTLIKTIMSRYMQGFYAKTEQHFDPAPHFAHPELPAPPPSLYAPSEGEVPYLYWEAEEVAALFGDALATAVKRADRMDLYNIAALLPEHALWDSAPLLLAHPQCGRGIAQMLFWRLYSRYGDRLLSLIGGNKRAFYLDFVEKWQAGTWGEPATAYDPAQDGNIRLPDGKTPRRRKNAWEIPALLKQPV